MPLINLSSKNQPDDAKFANYFNENIIVEPNSYICLIAASVIERDNYKVINISAGTTMTIRFDPLNQIEKTLAVIDTEYSPQQFVNHVNGLFGGLKCFASRFLATLDGDKINFKIFYASNFDFDTNYLNYTYGTLVNNAWQPFQKYPFITQAYIDAAGAPTGYENAGGESNNNWKSITFKDTSQGAGTGKSFIMPRVPYNYTIAGGAAQNLEITATNSNNRILSILSGTADAHDVGTTLDTYSFFTISGCPSKINDVLKVYELAFSNVEQQTAGGAFQAAAVPEFHEEYSHRSSILFKGDGNMDTIFYNYETDARDTINTQAYFIGDHFTIGIARNTIVPIQRRYVPNITRYSYEGLVFWFPNNLTYTDGLAQNYNTYQTLFYPGKDFLQLTTNYNYQTIKDNLFDSTATTLRGNGCMMGCWAGTGINTAEISGGAEWKGLIADPISKDTAAATQWVNWATNCGILRRVDTTTPEPATGTSSKRNFIEFPKDLTFNNPTCITFLVYFRDDSAVATTNPWRNTLCGSNNNATFKALLGQNDAAGDIEISDNAGNTQKLILTSGAGARISIAYNKWYYVSYEDSGLVTATQRNFNISMTDLDTQVEYLNDGNTLGGSHTLNPIRVLGGKRNDTIATLTEHYMYGIIADFRVWNKPRTATFVANDWVTLTTGIKDGYLDTLLWTDEMWGKPSVTRPYELSEAKYCNMNESNLFKTFTPQFICESKAAGDANGTLPDFVDLQFPHNVKIPVDERSVGTSTASLVSYGSGLTQAQQLNNDLTLPGIDATYRVLNEVPEGAFRTGEANPIFNLDTTPNDIDLKDEVLNVEIPNLPHRTFNGTNNTIDKTIYQLPVESKNIVGNDKITEHSPATKVWIPLNNPMEIPLNRLEVQISSEDGKKVTHLSNDTHVSVQIENKNSIFN